MDPNPRLIIDLKVAQETKPHAFFYGVAFVKQ